MENRRKNKEGMWTRKKKIVNKLKEIEKDFFFYLFFILLEDREDKVLKCETWGRTRETWRSRCRQKQEGRRN